MSTVKKVTFELNYKEQVPTVNKDLIGDKLKQEEFERIWNRLKTAKQEALKNHHLMLTINFVILAIVIILYFSVLRSSLGRFGSIGILLLDIVAVIVMAYVGIQRVNSAEERETAFLNKNDSFLIYNNIQLKIITKLTDEDDHKCAGSMARHLEVTTGSDPLTLVGSDGKLGKNIYFASLLHIKFRYKLRYARLRIERLSSGLFLRIYFDSSFGGFHILFLLKFSMVKLESGSVPINL